MKYKIEIHRMFCTTEICCEYLCNMPHIKDRCLQDICADIFFDWYKFLTYQDLLIIYVNCMIEIWRCISYSWHTILFDLHNRLSLGSRILLMPLVFFHFICAYPIIKYVHAQKRASFTSIFHHTCCIWLHHPAVYCNIYLPTAISLLNHAHSSLHHQIAYGTIQLCISAPMCVFHHMLIHCSFYHQPGHYIIQLLHCIIQLPILSSICILHHPVRNCSILLYTASSTRPLHHQLVNCLLYLFRT